MILTECVQIKTDPEIWKSSERILELTFSGSGLGLSWKHFHRLVYYKRQQTELVSDPSAKISHSCGATMPALNDFAQFVYFAQNVAKKANNTLNSSVGETCSAKVTEILQGAKSMTTGQTPGQYVAISADNVLASVMQGSNEELEKALQSLSATLAENPMSLYEVMDVYATGALKEAVVAACIDDTFEKPKWRDAFRYAVTEEKEHTDFFHAMLIGNAFNKGKLLKSLASLNFDEDADLMSMYGKYVRSDSVSAQKILFEVASVRSPCSELRGIAIESMMWSLTALDKNDGASNDPWRERVLYQMEYASVPLLTRNSITGLVRKAETNFQRELQTAKADSQKLSRKKDATYVTGLLLRQAMACVYTIAMVLFSILCGVLDWNKRNRFFDQAKDTLEMATFFLVSIFGLFKLTSEDPNALKNLVNGKSLVVDLDDASRLLESSTESMQKLLSIEKEMLDWVAAEGCSYGRNVLGAGLDACPASVKTLKQSGFFFLEGYSKRPHYRTHYDIVQKVATEITSVAYSKNQSSQCMILTPIFSKVA